MGSKIKCLRCRGSLSEKADLENIKIIQDVAGTDQYLSYPHIYVCDTCGFIEMYTEEQDVDNERATVKR